MELIHILPMPNYLRLKMDNVSISQLGVILMLTKWLFNWLFLEVKVWGSIVL